MSYLQHIALIVMLLIQWSAIADFWSLLHTTGYPVCYLSMTLLVLPAVWLLAEDGHRFELVIRFTCTINWNLGM